MPSFMQHYNVSNYVTLLYLVVYRFYCMALYHSNTQRHVINNCLSVISCQSYFCCSLGFQSLLKSEHSLKACFDNHKFLNLKTFTFGKNRKLNALRCICLFAFHPFEYVFAFHVFQQKLKPNCQKLKIKVQLTMF